MDSIIVVTLLNHKNLILHWARQLKPCNYHQSLSFIFFFKLISLITELNDNPCGDDNLLLYNLIRFDALTK